MDLNALMNMAYGGAGSAANAAPAPAPVPAPVQGHTTQANAAAAHAISGGMAVFIVGLAALAFGWWETKGAA